MFLKRRSREDLWTEGLLRKWLEVFSKTHRQLFVDPQGQAKDTAAVFLAWKKN